MWDTLRALALLIGGAGCALIVGFGIGYGLGSL